MEHTIDRRNNNNHNSALAKSQKQMGITTNNGNTQWRQPYCVPTNDYMYELTKDSSANTMHINSPYMKQITDKHHIVRGLMYRYTQIDKVINTINSIKPLKMNINYNNRNN